MDRYYKFSRYLKDRFGCRVYKVSIDAGFSCPNKDGSLSKDGCIYCDNNSFSFNTRMPQKPVEEQIEEGINFGKVRYGAEKFIIYFQAYTNTYAPLDILKQRYDIIKNFGGVVGINIGTRPDFVDEEILDLISGYSSEYEVWLEYGLQSIHDETLRFINRNHAYKDFLKAVDLARKRKLKVCAHVIIGLPNETEIKILQTAKELGRLKIDGVKIHPLHIVRKTKLEELFKEGSYNPLQLADFTGLAIGFLERLSPDTVIMRLGADCPREFLAGPLWVSDKSNMLNLIETTLVEKNTFQGRLYAERAKECLCEINPIKSR